MSKAQLTAQDIHKALDDIEQADPLGDLAAVLIGTGWSQDDLQSALGDRRRSPIGCTLINKYRDIARCG